MTSTKLTLNIEGEDKEITLNDFVTSDPLRFLTPFQSAVGRATAVRLVAYAILLDSTLDNVCRSSATGLVEGIVQFIPEELEIVQGTVRGVLGYTLRGTCSVIINGGGAKLIVEEGIVGLINFALYFGFKPISNLLVNTAIEFSDLPKYIVDPLVAGIKIFAVEGVGEPEVRHLYQAKEFDIKAGLLLSIVIPTLVYVFDRLTIKEDDSGICKVIGKDANQFHFEMSQGELALLDE